jgi:hypothetical protein
MLIQGPVTLQQQRKTTGCDVVADIRVGCLPVHITRCPQIDMYLSSVSVNIT